MGDGGRILVSTPELVLQSSGQIFSATNGAAKAGDINLSVPKSLQMIGSLPNEIEGGVSISSLSLGSGRSGNINIITDRLNVSNGGYILTSNVTPTLPGITSEGSGNIIVNATDVEVKGVAPDLSIPSAISAATASNGQAGNVTINTARLKVSNGGRVDSSTGASGTAGSVSINASKAVEITGKAPDFSYPSIVVSSASILGKNLQELLKLPPVPSGNSGNVNIFTPELNITNGGQVTVVNEGTGNAGNLKVKARSINLDSDSDITATAASGEGGNIFLRSQSLQLRNGSSITTDATGGTGNGGNITINAGSLAALPNENSDISANAIRGRGGNIRISTQGLFGTQFREQPTSSSDITASSRFGVNGVVNIRNLGFDPKNSLTPFAAKFISTESLLANSCLARRNKEQGRFVVTGSGALPLSPFSEIDEFPYLSGIQAKRQEDGKILERSHSSAPTSSPAPVLWEEGDPVVEARTIFKTADGRTLLGVSPGSVKPQPVSQLVCQGD